MSLRHTLSSLHARHVVGRDDEQRLFDALLAPDGPVVLVLDGPSGIGKSTLLRVFADRAGACDVDAYVLPLAASHASPMAFLEMLHGETPLVFSSSGLARTDRPDAPFVLLLDGAEQTPDLSAWLRHRFVPAFPPTARLVVAGETADAAAWRTDPLLGPLVVTRTVGPLDTPEAAALLKRRGVRPDEQAAILAFAHGHPLALTLAAETLLPDVPFNPHGPDLIGALLDRFLRLVPDATAQTALYAAALVRPLDEELLAEMLGLSADEARRRFEWLRRLPFVATGPRGLLLHDLLRRLLTDDLTWRAPDLRQRLHAAARRRYSQRLARADDARHAAYLADYLFLYRDNPVVAPLFSRLQQQWEGRALAGGPVREGDAADLVALLERHEGPDAARWWRYWHDRAPTATRVYREGDGPPLGLLTTLFLRDGMDDGGDPAVATALAFLRAHAPLREGETALLFRFWLDADTYQALSAVQSLVFVDTVRAYLTTPGLAFSLLPTAAPDTWALVFAFAGLDLVPEACFVQDGRSFAVFGHDWRRVPPSDWLDGIARIGMAAPTEADAAPVRAVFTHDAFADAVRSALRHALRVDVLRTHPLARTRLVARRVATTGETPGAALQLLLREAADALDATPRTRKLHRALVATFFDPAPSQEQAAERLDVPFSSYRRHLKAGIDAVVEGLWRDELDGSDGPVTDVTRP